LATYRLNRHSTAWKHEVQLYDLAQDRFNSQYGCDPRFANVHSMPLQRTARARIDSDVNLNFEAGLATGVGSKRSHCERIASLLSRSLILSASGIARIIEIPSGLFPTVAFLL
jgi:hypothetical protein